MSRLLYVIDAITGEVRPEPDVLTWGMFFESDIRFIAETEVGDKLVSTIFLGIDHNFGVEGPPVLWETAVNTLDKGWNVVKRYTSKERALLGAQNDSRRAETIVLSQRTGFNKYVRA